METATNHPPIIIIRKKKAHHAPHGGAWKVAYADFVTAMMALFIVLWLLASSQEVQKAVGGYFQDPTGRGKLQGTKQPSVTESLVVTKDDMDQLREKLEQAMHELPQFDLVQKNIQITMTAEGLRIELMENEGGLWFESGSAHISERGQGMFSMLAAQLKDIPNRLMIEGHTDAKPYPSTKGYTNWELSADRANTVRRILQEAGVGSDRIEQIRGFADQHLRNKSDPFDPMNRRVSLIVKYREAPLPTAEPPKPAGKAPPKAHHP
jgi:chemotaxis protein MotB